MATTVVTQGIKIGGGGNTSFNNSSVTYTAASNEYIIVTCYFEGISNYVNIGGTNMTGMPNGVVFTFYIGAGTSMTFGSTAPSGSRCSLNYVRFVNF